MLKLENIDLARDAAACWAIKDEEVVVEFADTPGVLMSAVGPNAYVAGDALVTGSTGDRWCVSRDRFDVKYRPQAPAQHGQNGHYRNLPHRIRAKRMEEAFTLQRTAGGDWLRGEAGDWLLEYAPGDHGVVAAARFASVYRLGTP